MTLKVVGAGFPRTGTTSMKSALEQLLGERCYHMFEMNPNGHQGLWAAALAGDMSALDEALDGFVATVDWPASLFWRELMDRNPDAVVVLTQRSNAETWWNSADRTVWALMRRPDNDEKFNSFHAAMRTKAGLGDDWDEPAAMQAYYDALYDEVVATVPPERLVVWQPSDGWEQLCAALDVPVPDDDFAHNNQGESFREKWGLDDPKQA